MKDREREMHIVNYHVILIFVIYLNILHVLHMCETN